MKRNLVILVTLFLMTACKDENSIPSGVLSKEKMQDVLWDMMRADQFLADYVLNKDTSVNKTTESLKYYQEVFAIHKINKEEFQHSFTFYKSHPALLKVIMDSISAPEKITPFATEETPPVTDTVIPQPDTLSKITKQVSPDTSTKKRRPKMLIAD